MAINTQSSQSQTSQSLETSMITSTSSSWYANNSNVACHNQSTARAQIVGTKEHAIVNSKRSESKSSPRLKCMGFVSPSGQYYAVVPNIRMGETIYDCRIDCSNESTLRSLMNGGVHLDTIHHAIQTPSNLRPTGGWAA